MDWIIFITAVLLSIFGYFVGLSRGTTEHEHDYDEGYLDGFKDATEERVKYDKVRVLVDALDDLFKDDEDEITLDGGEY